MCKTILPAKIENLQEMLDFIKDSIKNIDLTKKTKHKILISFEEITMNIISYAYPEIKDGKIEIICDNIEDEKKIIIKIIDWGIPFNPLSKEEPDLEIPIQERQIGGLGIFMVREFMDEVNYKREDGKNILIFIKFYN